MQRTLKIFLALGVLHCAVAAQAEIDDAARSRADAAVAAFLKPQPAPGFALAVFVGDRLAYSFTTGLRDIGEGLPITLDTRFCLGSVSKQFVAFAAFLLSEDGKLDLDGDLRSILPYIAGYAHPITPRQLIHHTSGLNDIWELFSLSDRTEEDVRTDDNLRADASRLSFQFEPGTNVLYNNIAYFLLADAIEAASGQPFEDYIRTAVFKPLGMNSTEVFVTPGQIMPRAALPTLRHGDGPWLEVPHSGYIGYGASDIWSTPNDVGRWLTNLQDPIPEHAAAAAQMFVSGATEDGRVLDYGGGLAYYTLAGQDVWGHGGDDKGGMQATVGIIDALDLSWVVLTNAGRGDDRYDRNEIRNAVLNALLGQTETVAAVEAPAVLGGDDPLVVTATGAYLSDRGQSIVIGRADDGLTLSQFGETRPLLVATDGFFYLEEAAGNPLGRLIAGPDGSVERIEYPLQPGTYDWISDTYKRLPPAGAADAGAFAGVYYSPEIDVLIEIESVDGGLMLLTKRFSAGSELIPIGEDTFELFLATTWYDTIFTTRFERDAEGVVQGFRVGNCCVANVAFVRVPALDHLVQR